MKIYNNDFGNIEVRTLQLPDYVKAPTGTYTPSGKVLVSYKRDNAINNIDKNDINKNDILQADKDYTYIAIVNDDGNDFRDIYEGIIKPLPTANGIRYMVYADNKRVLLGDYVLECIPDIDGCKSAELIPVKYPWGIDSDEKVFCHWSEIIIAPDNKHICWTMLTKGLGAVNMIGVLNREADSYVINDTQIISSGSFFIDKSAIKDGYLTKQIRRGGEVKQFIRGGTAISLVGAGKESILADTVVQDLMTEDVDQITYCPGYEETTIFSPDEKLGIVMSTRASAKSNCAVIGLLPRPCGSMVSGALIATAYQYSVSGVRQFRRGNIGPVLINIEKSLNDKNYMGAALNEPDDKWVYVSPMSWHPDNKKAMWPEMLKGNYDETRLRIVEIPDYIKDVTVPPLDTPDEIPYGIKDESKLWVQDDSDIKELINGRHSGIVELIKENVKARNADSKIIQLIEARYENYSDDGKSFYNGFEKCIITASGEYILEADLELIGEIKGCMKLRLTFAYSGTKVMLSFSDAEDGRPASYGYAEYNGIRINVEDMEE